MLRFARNYWFYFLLPPLLLVAYAVSRMPESLAAPAFTERVFLFDFLIFLPAIYYVFLRSRFSKRTSIIRAGALGLTGLWFAGWLMPEGTGEIIPRLEWLRALALPFFIVFELAVFAALMRYVFGDAPDEQKLISMGVPPFLVKALLLEVRFWKAVWAFLAKRR